jgi:anti-sigma B factor antagonist
MASNVREPGFDGEPLFECALRPLDDTLEIALTGELDFSTVSRFRTVLEEVASFEYVVLDLSSLGFIDSSGLRAILELQASLKGKPRLEVIPGTPDLQRIFAVTGLSEVLPFRSG